jgi:hypothetical protein
LYNFNIFNQREDRLVQKVNIYTKVTGVIIISSLVMLLFYIYNTLDSRGSNLGDCTFTNIFTTLFFIAIFQYSFYKYGKNYKYIGSYGKEELATYLLKKIK